MHAKNRPKVVAAIPCFNTERSIGDIASRAGRHVDQVIVIDDGSLDGTAEAAKAAGALVISHTSNRGYGAAIKSAFAAAKANMADVLVTLDGDGQHNPDEIPGLISPIVNGEADLVIGSRFMGNSHAIPGYRKLGISIITYLWNVGSKVKVSDTQSGFRAYSKKIFENLALSEKGMSLSIETLQKVRRTGGIIKEVPISCLYLSSTLNLPAVRHGLGVAFSVVRIRLKDSLRRRFGAK